jgi:pre-rRNA-processing protein IPI1
MDFTPSENTLGVRYSQPRRFRGKFWSSLLLFRIVAHLPQTIIRSLLRLLQRGSSVIKHEVRVDRDAGPLANNLIFCSSFLGVLQEIIGLRSRLTPFFLVTHPVRGRLPGPFTKIPASSPRVRRLAVDLVVTILSVSPKSEGEETRNLMDAVASAVSGTFEEGYWHQLVRATGLS